MIQIDNIRKEIKEQYKIIVLLENEKVTRAGVQELWRGCMDHSEKWGQTHTSQTHKGEYRVVLAEILDKMKFWTLNFALYVLGSKTQF